VRLSKNFIANCPERFYTLGLSLYADSNKEMRHHSGKGLEVNTDKAKYIKKGSSEKN
jgi:hypothetical protein